MFVYPPSTVLHRVVPKTKIYAHATASKRLKTLFASQVGEITWAHKLSPETLRLPARDGIEEIQVFSLALKSPDLDQAILQLIDRAIPFPLLFEMVHGDTIRFAAAYKRPSAADAKKWVVEATFQTESRALSVPRTALPVAVDLAGLHEHLLRAHIPLRARSAEALQALVERHRAVSDLRLELPRLETRLAREKQFNRRVEVNADLRRSKLSLNSFLPSIAVISRCQTAQTMDKLKLHTPDLTAANIEKLAALFPNCVTEATNEKGQLKRSIDFDLLRQELSDHIVEGPRERYHLDWPGKREALLAANAPIAKTLRPCREESINFDATRNLFIEGDNLDALKLLQETYLGKVNIIYIDPPYNTGEDFVYRDNFASNTLSYLRESNQVDDSAARLVVNPDSNGRFHSEWVSMMYARLKLARNLLRDEGVIFISIDDNEVRNVRNICDEIFGEENFIAQVVWEGANKNDASQIGVSHEYAVVYAKNRSAVPREWSMRKEGVDEVLEEVARLMKVHGKNHETASEELAGWFRAMKAKPVFGLRRFRYIDARGAYKEDDPTAPGGRRFELKNPRTGEVIPLRRNRGWGFDQAEFDRLVKEGRVSFITPTSIMIRRYLHETDTITPPSVFYQPARSASERLADLIGPDIFDFPKDEFVIRSFIEMATTGAGTEPIILDFFAGSGTTAHAAFLANVESGNRGRFILVQLPELCREGSEAVKKGFRTIADISRKRIIEAGKKVKAEGGITAQQMDTGFRVLKVDSSNMKDVYYAPDAVKQADLALHTDNIKEDRASEDLLFQVLVDWGVDLALPIEKQTISDHTVFFVDGNALAACFDSGVGENLVKEIAKRKPLRAVFRDSSFAGDSVKINVEQIFKLLSPDTEVKSL